MARIVKKKENMARNFERILKRLERLDKKWSSSLEKIDKNVKKLASELKVVKSLEDDVNRMWKFAAGLHKKMKKVKYRLVKAEKAHEKILQTWEGEVRETHGRLNELEDKLKDVGNLPGFYREVNEKVAELEKQYNSIASDVVERLEELEETVKALKEERESEDVKTLRDQVESIRKSLLTFNKLWADYKKEIDERLGLRPESLTPTRGIPQSLLDEINSLKRIVDRLSSENDQLRKLVREIRVTQMTSVTADMFADLTGRVSTLEKKVSEVEEGLSKLLKTKPVVME